MIDDLGERQAAEKKDAPKQEGAISGELSYLAGLTARGHNIEVRIGAPGSGSYANVDERKINLDPVHCETKAQARFVAAHEGAHIGESLSLKQMGKSPQEIRKYAGMIGLHSLWNVIEDGAINDRMCIQYPPLQDDTRASYPRVDSNAAPGLLNGAQVQQMAALLGRVPRYAEALAGLLADWSELRHELGFGRPLEEYQAQPRRGGTVSDPAVQEFYDSVLNQARRTISMIPGPNDSAQVSFDKSLQRHTWVETVLYPELRRLVELDLKDIENEVKQEMAKQKKEDQGEDEGDKSQGGGGLKPSQDAEAKRQAREKLSELDDAIREALESLKESAEKEVPKTSDVVKDQTRTEREVEAEQKLKQEQASVSKQLKDALNAALTPYHQEYREISGMLETAYNRLIDVFEPERHFKWRTDLPSGSRVNLRRAMEFEVTGQGHEKVWMQRVDPQYPDMAVVILIDRSSSMEQLDKYIHARRATVFTKELFERLNIPTACGWFADRSGVAVGFDADISEDSVQEELMKHSVPLDQGTNDAAGIRTAANLLSEHSASQKVIVMLSDAQSGETENLKKIVRELDKDGVPVLHFGLGSGTKDEAGLYLHSWGDLDLHKRGEGGFLSVFCAQMEKLAQGALRPR